MKRIIAITLCLVTLLALSACSGGTAYKFSANGTEVYPGMDAKSLSALFDGVKYDSSSSCGGFDGEDRVYYFSGYRIYTTPYAKGDMVNKIELTDDSSKTDKNITVGQTREQVISAYGDKYEEVGDNLKYVSSGVALCFIFRDGKVTNIQYIIAD